MVMDATLAKYMKLSIEEAFDEIKEIIAKTKEVKGKFVLLWHNSSMSKIDGYAGWDELLNKTLEFLKKQVER